MFEGYLHATINGNHHAFKFKEWLKHLLKWMFLQNIAKKQQQQQKTVEENV
jgi:hypothetical protein